MSDLKITAGRGIMRKQQKRVFKINVFQEVLGGVGK
jgi:hypothetical protein